MNEQFAEVLKNKMDASSFAKLDALGNDKLCAFVVDVVGLCRPDKVKVCDDSPADIAFCRQLAIDNREERSLAVKGHTAHFDGYFDQGRDKEVTKYLLPKGMDLGERLNSMDRDEGLKEIRGFFAGAMKGRTMLVRFFCLGPTNSAFSISCAQITDSAYVCHSEDMLYRPGYEQFKRLGGKGDFFRFLHATGKVDERMASAEPDKKRIYIDITEDMVMSVNTQYAGNTVGLKKLALRLAIRKADREGWLAEHMFLMGSRGPGGRVTYFVGAFPSACGKTSTAMLPGETILGDDIAYLRLMDGQMRAVNVEAGIFGIIADVSAKGDPLIWDVLHAPGEVIFGNVLLKDRMPYWLGMGEEIPSEGENFIGRWTQGAKGPDGKEVPPAHKNARYTIRLRDLANLDPNFEDPQGVPVGGVIYGGRDSDTSVPVTESFDWVHGVVTMGSALESETTSATLGAEGVRTFDLMSNLQFLAIPIGKYIQNHLDFGAAVKSPPKMFNTNYFLKSKDGKYLNGMLDKSVWVKWAELRTHGDVQAIKGPCGYIPKYEDIKKLFQQVLKKDYTEAQYLEQFQIRTPELLAKIARIEKIYRGEADTPKIVLDTLAAQRERLETLRKAKGDYVAPTAL